MRLKNNQKKQIITLFLAACIALLGGCGIKGQIMDGDGMVNSYKQITQEEAKEMMKRDDGHLIVDVRRPDEFAEGHSPGAVNVPNEEIADEQPAALPDQAQILLIYCRSGRRSKEAAQKLFDMGYRNIYEFGGIIDWTGEAVADEKNESPETKTVPVLILEANGKQFSAVPEDNSSAEAFIEKLSAEPLTLELRDYGCFEKVGALPWKLPTNDERITTKPGDVILYQGNQITVYYDENTWSFTKLASIGNATKEALLDAFGEGDVTIRFWIEWSE